MSLTLESVFSLRWHSRLELPNVYVNISYVANCNYSVTPRVITRVTKRLSISVENDVNIAKGILRLKRLREAIFNINATIKRFALIVSVNYDS